MMCTLNSHNVKFIQNYNHVLEHHVECILNYPLALYEDKQLLRIYWNGYTLYKQKRWNRFIISAGCAAFGLAISIRVKNVQPFVISLLPCSVPIYTSINCSYSSRRYESNFEELLCFMLKGFILICEIREHFYKFKVLEKFSENNRKFSKFAFQKFVSCLDEIKSTILIISKLVPLIETDIGYRFDNLITLHEFIATDTVPLNLDFQKLMGDYILFVSYFLNCIGMCLCDQLWSDGSCNFKNIFDSIIPKANLFFKTTIKEIKCEYGQICSVLNKFIDQGSEGNFIRNSMDPTPLSQNDISYLSLHCTSNIFALTDKIIKQCFDPYTLKTNFANFLSSRKERKADHKIDLSHLNSREDQICYENIWGLKDGEDNILSIEDSAGSDQAILQNLQYLLHPDDERYQHAWATKFLNPHSDERLNISTSTTGNNRSDLLAIENNTVNDEEVGRDLVLPFSIENISAIDDLMSRPISSSFNSNPWEITEVTVENETTRQRLERITNERKSESTTTGSLSPLPLLPPPRVSLEANPNNEDNGNGLEDMLIFQQTYSESILAQKLNEFHFGFNMYPDMPRPFNTTYSCYSVAMLPGNERQDVERGGKIIMPPSALEQLTRLNINYPMLFKITNKKTNCKTHCGVLEFVADEGKVYLPLWMMQNLVLEEGNLIQIESVSLPVGTFAKFQPVSSDFLDISNPKAVLENCLRTFACLTAGDVIAVTYNQKVYELNVMETKPGEAISIIECDMNVEFAAPVGYKEEVRYKPKEEDVIVDPAELMPAASGFVPFKGDGNRLDGKPRKDSASTSAAPVKAPYVKGIPDYDWEFGTLSFSRHFVKTEENNEIIEEFKPFHGTGHSLR